MTLMFLLATVYSAGTHARGVTYTTPIKTNLHCEYRGKADSMIIDLAFTTDGAVVGYMTGDDLHTPPDTRPFKGKYGFAGKTMYVSTDIMTRGRLPGASFSTNYPVQREVFEATFVKDKSWSLLVLTANPKVSYTAKCTEVETLPPAP